MANVPHAHDSPIVLKAGSTLPGYEPIVLREEQAEGLKVVWGAGGCIGVTELKEKDDK